MFDLILRNSFLQRSKRFISV